MHLIHALVAAQAFQGLPLSTPVAQGEPTHPLPEPEPCEPPVFFEPDLRGFDFGLHWPAQSEAAQGRPTGQERAEVSTPKLYSHVWSPHDWSQYRTGMKGWNWFEKIPQPQTSPGEAMTPTTSDRFFTLAARVESALPDAGFTKEQAAELVGSLRTYWERPSEQALEALKATQDRIINTAIREGRLNRDHNVLSAHFALSRAAEAFFDNEPDTFIMDVPGYLDRCEHRLEYKQ